MARLGAVRLGKGVRMSVSSRGLRAHVGPRAARVHFGGGGRTGISTGTGPFTYYTSGGSSRRRSSAGYGSPTKAELARMEKLEEGDRLRHEILSIVEIHRADFPPARKPDPEPPSRSSLDRFLKQRQKQKLDGIPIFKRSERKEAKERASELAAEDLKREQGRLDAEHAEAVARIEQEWKLLLGNDPETVIATVDEAFEDNEAPAAPVNVEDSILSLVVLVPDIEEIPERKPAVTPSGNPTVKKLTKAERSDLYLTLICGHTLATIKEALAVAPSISAVKAVVVRRGSDDVFGDKRIEVLLAAMYERSDLARVKWQDVLPSDVMQEAAVELLWRLKGRPKELQPLDLEDHPDLKDFAEALGKATTA